MASHRAVAQSRARCFRSLAACSSRYHRLRLKTFPGCPPAACSPVTGSLAVFDKSLRVKTEVKDTNGPRRRREVTSPFRVVVQSEEEFDGDDGEGGGPDVVLGQHGAARGFRRAARHIRRAAALHQLVQPRVEIVWQGGGVGA